MPRQVMADLLAMQPPPFAICAFNDDVASAALAALVDLNIAVPETVSVIGANNNQKAELTNPQHFECRRGRQRRRYLDVRLRWEYTGGQGALTASQCGISRLTGTRHNTQSTAGSGRDGAARASNC